MNFWLYWTFISLGVALGLIILAILWWFFGGGKENERKIWEQKERKKRIIMEVNRIADYEYEVIIDGQRTVMDLEKLMRLLSSPVKKEPAKNEVEEFWKSEPAYPDKQ